MPSAGETIIAGKIPGERIATNINTADSAGFSTTETATDQVTAALVTGRIYRVSWQFTMQSSTSADLANIRLREDSASGTQLTAARVDLGSASAGSGPSFHLEAEYTAVSTANKTFVGTGQRQTGAGTIVAEGAATQPRYIYVDYIR